MSKLLHVIFIALFCSCGTSRTDTHLKEKPESQFTENEDSTPNTKTKKTSEGINIILKDALKGIWASNEYREALFKSNSITSAEKTITFYTDIVFAGGEILHCNKPSFMEQHYLYLKPDSSVADQKGTFAFKLILVENQIMKIEDSTGRLYSYRRVAETPDLGRIYIDVTKGTNAIKKEWMANTYQIMLDTLKFNAELLKNGGMMSDLHFKWFTPFSYLNEDIVEYGFNDESTLLYRIKEYSDTIITLEGIEDITEMDAPIVPNGKVGYMKKI